VEGYRIYLAYDWKEYRPLMNNGFSGSVNFEELVESVRDYQLLKKTCVQTQLLKTT
jgi:hypothetical protein